MDKILITDIIQQLKDVETADLWIEENFEKKLRTVNDANAFVRPLPDLHSIAELISHLTEWRREVMNRLQGNRRGLEMTDEANWRTNEALRPQGWERLKKNFYDSQRQVIALLEDKDDDFLETPYPHADPGFPYNFKYLLTGLIQHDLYHLGQMGITIKFLNKQASQ